MSGTRTDPPVVTAGPDKITADQSEAITRNDTPETLTEAEAKVTVQRINAAVQNLTFLVNKLYAGRGWVAAPHQVGAR